MTLRRTLSMTAVTALLFAAALAPAQPGRGKATPKETAKAATAATLSAAQGTVAKADGDSLTIRPRGAEGRFEKELVLQVTGTTRVTQLSVQTRAGKPVAVQQDADVKSLQPQQTVAVIYAQTGGGMVLLSAVVLPGK
jgi:hypothetical protein